MTPDDTLTAEIVEDVCKLWADQGMQVSLDHCMVEALSGYNHTRGGEKVSLMVWKAALYVEEVENIIT